MYRFAMTEWKIEISGEASREDEIALRDALLEFNFEATGYRDGRSLSCFLYEDQLVAGIDGFTWGGYARIEFLWVAETYRGEGLGSRLLAAAENEARARGCLTVILDSHSFQAPNMYLTRGYVAVGTIKNAPKGYTQTIFQKAL